MSQEVLKQPLGKKHFLKEGKWIPLLAHHPHRPVIFHSSAPKGYRNWAGGRGEGTVMASQMIYFFQSRILPHHSVK